MNTAWKSISSSISSNTKVVKSEFEERLIVISFLDCYGTVYQHDAALEYETVNEHHVEPEYANVTSQF